ncbi:hypothetical protein [Streptomyces sp. NPDC048473]|uniref:hypothetical protein n=1 Tax=unclassified Streptomyces TaxID=2593676 RepID=UPI003712769A
MAHLDVVVIGGGQSGLAATYAPGRRGPNLVALEAFDQAAGTGTHAATRSSSTSCVTPTTWTPTSAPGTTSGRSAEQTGASVSPWRTAPNRPRAAQSPPPAASVRPNLPTLPGLDTCTGRVLHVKDCHSPEAFACLAPLGALDENGHPGTWTERPSPILGSASSALSWQRSLPSAPLCDVGRDADRIARRLARHLARP